MSMHATQRPFNVQIMMPPDDMDLDQLTQIYEATGMGADVFVEVLHSRDALGGAIFVATDGETVIGTASAVAFGLSGWIGGVAVLPRWRRGGVGTALTRVAVDWLAAHDVRTTFLLATAAGRAVYQRLGFEREEHYAFFAVPERSRPSPSPHLRAGRADDLDLVIQMYRNATGETRDALIARSWPVGGTLFERDGVAIGFSLASDWEIAAIAVSEDPEVGYALLDAVVAGDDRTLRVPVPLNDDRFVKLLEQHGYVEMWRAQRMRLGPPIPRGPQVRLAGNFYWG
ncbi:GNAT family N-acetyltransferase [Microbispora triticiradicis]|uniref:GNAT family N-acetyltransferase n=1 Tax=Microbispora triticiradicis TaxID=2200763 RepID=UPI001AD703FB|nr:GNAT family N-acetyltransferase [Microbispora triticiradicis]MBO4273004.1 GNAT family N-acetyltransferase [Microbispora triticiradicis]